MTEDQEALLRKASENLRAAKLLLKEDLNEVAVSRAYYSMFYIAQAFLLGRGLMFAKHGSVLAAFGQHFVKTGDVPAQYHRYLIAAFEKRLKGDYDFKVDISSAEADGFIKHAEEFIALAEEKLGPLPPAANPPQSAES